MGAGQFADLSFVRQLTEADISVIDAARRQASEEADSPTGPDDAGGDIVITAYTDPCVGAVSYAERTICKDMALRDLRDMFNHQWERVERQYPDAQAPQEAARRQLDACTSSLCVTKALQDWTQYLLETYPDTDPEYE